jgi:hypothetical protein
MRALLLSAIVLVLAAAARAAEPAASVRTGLALGDHLVRDLDGDGAADLLLVGVGGRVRVWRKASEGAGMAEDLVGELSLPRPNRSLMAVGDVLGRGGPPQLLVLSPDRPMLYPAAPGGGFAAEGNPISRRGRFQLRVGAPRFTEILTDLNDDGRPDLLVPNAWTCEIYLNEGPADESAVIPRFRRTAEVATDLRRTREYEGTTLSDQLESAFRIPRLSFQDVNGDGRPDLVVVDDERRGFHLQREDGSLPETPDRVLDLTIFVDTTPPATIRPGRTLAAGDDASLSMQDLDGDGIPDYVISHRRKIWVFHGSKDGPQFTEPSDILALAEDVSALLVLPLDDDDRPDLLLVRVEIPSVASILRGFFAEMEVEIKAAGYRGLENGKFSKTSTWKGGVTVRLPALGEILKNPQAILSRFEETASKFRRSLKADFDGDGSEDVALVSEDMKRIDVWRMKDRKPSAADEIGVRALFFEDKDREWSLDRILTWLSDLAERRVQSLTGGRDPDVKIRLRDPADFTVLAVETGNLAGGKAAGIIVLYADPSHGGECVVDLYSVK